jgi:hypothetical protein
MNNNNKGEKEMKQIETSEYFSLLDEIRESGEMNMFGAPSWLVENCDLTRTQAKEVFFDWTETFREEE